MRNMSFSMTTPQMRARTKTVTRRLGWWHLKPGDRVRAVVKCMGLKKGETVEPICEIEIVSTRKEPLFAVTPRDVGLEGYPGETQRWFILKFMSAMKCTGFTFVNRIEFKHVEVA